MKFKPCIRAVVAVCGFILFTLFNANSYAYHVDNTRNFDFSLLTPKHELARRNLECLALNIYHEGRGEPARGQAAIAAVTMNRVHSKSYPNSVCEVVWQTKQFSWTGAPIKYHAVTDFVAWAKVLVVAKLFLDGAQVALIGDATHYHADTVRPYWVADNKLVGKIGRHYFYAL